MFADLVGSTALSAQLDPEDLRDLLATYHRMVSEVVKAHGGHVAQYLGDGALIYFGYPMSHEDDGERALETGLSLLKHALVQDAAYSTLLRGQKQSLHRSIAQNLSERSGAEKVAELIARHYREARDSLEAAEWRLKAGEASNRRYAYREAVENLREGLDDAGLLPDTVERKEVELKLNVALSVPLIALYSFTAGPAAEVVARAEALSLELGKPRPPRLLYHRSLVHHLRADYSLVIPVARELEESMRGDPLELRGAIQRNFAEMMSGHDVVIAKNELEEVFERLRRLGPEVDYIRHEYTYDIKAAAVPSLSMSFWHAGYPDQAVRVCDYGRERAAEISHAMTMCGVLTWEILIHFFRGDFVKMNARAQELHEVSSREELPVFFPIALQSRAFPTAVRGDLDGGLSIWERARALVKGTNTKIGQTLGMRARILDLAHRGEEAIEAIDTVLEEVHGSEENILSDLTRLRGEFLMRYRGPDAEPEAEKEFQEALGFARKQRALSYELRAAHSMANLMRSRGDEAGALDLLEPVFNRFTEGFDTADLISAKRTIDELKLRRDAVAPLAFSADA